MLLIGCVHLFPLAPLMETPTAIADLAHRLLWSMARDAPAWDVVAGAGLVVDTHARLRQLCEVVDDAVHTTAHALRPHFGLQWNRLKVWYLGVHVWLHWHASLVGLAGWLSTATGGVARSVLQGRPGVEDTPTGFGRAVPV